MVKVYRPEENAGPSSGNQSKVLSNEEEYPIDRVSVIIFNNVKFSPEMKCPERFNSEKDVKKLEVCFKKLNYLIEIHVDRKRDEIIADLQKASEMDVDCLWIIIMTHGHNGKLRAYDKKYTETDVFNIFDGKMQGIPKVFVFQASRIGAYATPKLPNDDMFAIWSTEKNSSSYRSMDKGSFFVNGLVKQLEELRSKSRLDFEVQHILKIVNDESNRNGVLQKPEYKSNLKKVLPIYAVDKNN